MFFSNDNLGSKVTMCSDICYFYCLYLWNTLLAETLHTTELSGQELIISHI
jgi:hypothetical protein